MPAAVDAILNTFPVIAGPNVKVATVAAEVAIVVDVLTPNALTVVATVLNTACVVFAPTRVPGRTVSVAPVALPMVVAVLAPNALTVVATVL